jgi:hypothetical protein
MRDFLKALPLTVGLPLVIGAASVGPDDAASNISKWLREIGINHVPKWLTDPKIDNAAIWGAFVLAALYAVVVWVIIPQVARRHATLRQTTHDREEKVAPLLGGTEKITQSIFDTSGGQVSGRWFGKQFVLDKPIAVISTRCDIAVDGDLGKSTAQFIPLNIGVGEPNALGQFRYHMTGRGRVTISSLAGGPKTEIYAEMQSINETTSEKFDLVINDENQIELAIDRRPGNGSFTLLLLGWTRPGREP